MRSRLGLVFGVDATAAACTRAYGVPPPDLSTCGLGEAAFDASGSEAGLREGITSLSTIGPARCYLSRGRRRLRAEAADRRRGRTSRRRGAGPDDRVDPVRGAADLCHGEALRYARARERVHERRPGADAR